MFNMEIPVPAYIFRLWNGYHYSDVEGQGFTLWAALSDAMLAGRLGASYRLVAVWSLAFGYPYQPIMFRTVRKLRRRALSAFLRDNRRSLPM